MNINGIAALGRALLTAERVSNLKQATRDFLTKQHARGPLGPASSAMREAFGASEPALAVDSPVPTLDNPFEILIVPATNVSSSYTDATGCHSPTNLEMQDWVSTAAAANAQFREYGIAVTLTVAPSAALNATATQPHIPIVMCDELHAGGFFAGGGPGAVPGATIAIHDNTPYVRLHELGHAVTLSHPHDFSPMKTLGPDLQEVFCEGSTVGGQSSMAYKSECASSGYVLGDLTTLDRMPYSDLDLCGIQLSTTNWTEHEALLTQCENRVHDTLAAIYGARIAGFFAAAMAAQVMERLLTQAILRNVTDPVRQNLAIKAVACFGQLVQAAGIVHAISTGGVSAAATVFMVAITGKVSRELFATGVFSEPVRALADSFGHQEIAVAVVGAARGSLWPAAAMAAAYGGRTMGNVFVAAFEALAERCCSPLPPDAREILLKTRASPVDEHDSPARCIAVDCTPVEESVEIDATANESESQSADVNDNADDETDATMREKLTKLSHDLARVIDNYFTLNCLTTWIYKSDQDKAEAAGDLQAGIAEAFAMADIAVHAPDPVPDSGSTESSSRSSAAEGAETSTAVASRGSGVNWGPPLAEISDDVEAGADTATQADPVREQSEHSNAAARKTSSTSE